MTQLQSLDAVTFEDHYDHDVVHPTTHEPLVMANGDPQQIRLMRPDAEPLRKLSAKWRNEEIKGMRRNAAVEEARTTEYLVTATIDWQLQGADGPIPHSDKAARALYDDPDKRWLRRQVLAALGDEANYAVLGESAAA